MIRPEETFFHPDITKWLATGGDYVVGGQSFLQANPVRTDILDSDGVLVCVEFEAEMRFDDFWVMVGVSIGKGDPILDTWMMKGYGGDWVTVPKVTRKQTLVQSLNREGSVLNHFRVGHLDPDGSGQVVNGQAVCPIYFTFNTTNGFVDLKDTPEPFAISEYIPYDGNDTGGDWKYMGIDYPIGDVQWCRKMFYPMAGYGGHFLKKSGGMLSEKDWPKAVLTNGVHWHRDTPTWIVYTDPRNPWMDKATKRNPDSQHWSVYDAPAQAGKKFPRDMALRWLNAWAAHRFLMQIPGEDKGTYQWKPGQARSRGRIPKYVANGVNCIQLFDGDLTFKIGKRGLDRLANQMKDWMNDLRNGITVIPFFEGRDDPIRPDKHAPHEVGLWYNGLDAIDEVLEQHNIDIPELDYMKRHLASFCFDSYYLDSRGVIQIPYYVTTAWDHPLKSSGGRHFSWFAAMHAYPENKEEEDKMEALIEYGKGLEPRWKGNL